MPDWLTIHFLRPGWLVGVPIAALLTLSHWRLRRASGLWRGRIAPHLLEHLLVRPERATRLGPAAWLFAVLALGSIALSGPSWERTPPPFAEDDAALVLILDLSEDMLRAEPPPSRLLHARLRLRDLLSLRRDERIALIALGATAHRVLPFTTDAAAIRSYLDVLDPGLMPAAPPHRTSAAGGRFDDALSLAGVLLEREGRVGSVLLVTGEPPRTLSPAIAPVVWTVARDAPPHLAWADDSIRWHADGSDVEAVNRALSRRLQAARNARDGDSRWRDGGTWLLAPLVLLALLGARRGWSLRW